MGYMEGKWVAYRGANGHWYVRCEQGICTPLVADCGIEGEANAYLIAKAPAMHKTLANIKHAWDTGTDAKSRYYHEVQAGLFDEVRQPINVAPVTRKSKSRQVARATKQIPCTGIRNIRQRR